MFSAHDSTGAVAADQLIHLIRRRKVEVKFDRVLQAGGTEAVTETAASVTDAQTAFTFTDSGINVEGSSDGYECNGTALTIDAAGTYLLSDSCTDGSVKIKKGTTGVRLILSGLSLTSADTAPITCNKSSEVVIVAADGTENVLTDAAANNDESNSGNENAENAVIKCKDGSAVTLCGAGTLTLNAYGKNGIKSGATTAEEGEASLTIRELTLNINASVNDAINAEQYLAVESGTLNLATADVALHCDLIMDIGAEGTDGPTIAIAEACEGIEAAALSIRSGDISIVCTDDCLNAANSDLANYDFAINISGGTIVAYTTAGDGFDSNGILTISGGNVTVWSGGNADNQPLDADGTITITGGSAGIGLASAKALAEQGAKVYITGRRQEELDAAVRFIGPAARAIRADAAVLSDLDAVFATIAEESGRLDVLFANAGGGDMLPLSAITEAHVDRIFATNVRGVVFTVQKALPLLADGASVILTGSTAAVKGTANFSIYSSSKAAVRSLARSWALEVSDRGIRINVVSPGPVRTPGLGGLVAEADRQGLFDALAAGVPLGRLGEPEEIGRTVVFLASDESSFINAAEIYVDGGLAQI